MRPLLFTFPSSFTLFETWIRIRFAQRDFIGCWANHADTLYTLFMEIAVGYCNVFFFLVYFTG